MAEAVNSSVLRVDIQKRFPEAGSIPFQLRIAAEFAPGFTVIFGPSGAGKSTLLDCIAGIATPDAGTITLDRQIFFDVARKTVMPPQQRRIGYVFQTLALFPHLTVRENIRFGIARKPETEQRAQIEQILRAMHIEKLVDRKPFALSGGEKQRVALARSLVTQPRLLLLDEPLTGLDAGLRQSILDDLREWNAVNRVPTLYVTHNREEVDAVGERVVALVDGHVRESGLPREVLDAPRTVALAQASGFENLLSGRVIEHRPEDGVTRVELAGNHCELEVPLGSATVGSVVQIAIRAGDILLAKEAPQGLSARNVLAGSVKTMEERGTFVVVQVLAGIDFEVHVTAGAVRALDLRAGIPVWLVLKTHSCHVVIPR